MVTCFDCEIPRAVRWEFSENYNMYKRTTASSDLARENLKFLARENVQESEQLREKRHKFYLPQKSSFWNYGGKSLK